MRRRSVVAKSKIPVARAKIIKMLKISLQIPKMHQLRFFAYKSRCKFRKMLQNPVAKSIKPVANSQIWNLQRVLWNLQRDLMEFATGFDAFWEFATGFQGICKGI